MSEDIAVKTLKNKRPTDKTQVLGLKNYGYSFKINNTNVKVIFSHDAAAPAFETALERALVKIATVKNL